MKSAWEIALERLEEQGIEKPRDEALSDDARAQAGAIRQRTQASIAQLEILHRDRLTKLAEPAAQHEEEQNYLRERQRLEDRRERDIRKLRES